MSVPIPEPVFVLVRPQMGENIGAAARAMANFGLGRMRIVAPRDGWPNPKAKAMAAGAGRVLDAAQIHETTAQAIADCTRIYATTARERGLSKSVLTPQEAMADAVRATATGERVAVLFGPERAGLENEDIARAGAIISVPVDPGFASLNLAQCALLTAYEWRRHAVTDAAQAAASEPTASALEIEKLGDHYEDTLERAGFFFPDLKARSMKLTLRNMWSRLPLTQAEVRILHGILRQMERWKDRG